MDTSIRFRIATRIRHALIRELGRDIDVVRMLGAEDYARDVLTLCDACGKKELTRLARHLRMATEQEQLSAAAKPKRRGNGPEAAAVLSSTGPRRPIAPSAASIALIRDVAAQGDGRVSE